MAVVYEHREADTNRRFYIGYSRDKALNSYNSKHGRTAAWKKVYQVKY